MTEFQEIRETLHIRDDSLGISKKETDKQKNSFQKELKVVFLTKENCLIQCINYVVDYDLEWGIVVRKPFKI